jgi:hypothetical protein
MNQRELKASQGQLDDVDRQLIEQQEDDEMEDEHRTVGRTGEALGVNEATMGRRVQRAIEVVADATDGRGLCTRSRPGLGNVPSQLRRPSFRPRSAGLT